MSEPVQIGRKSSAATTTFCAAEVQVGGETLYVDGNQKITAGNGSYANPMPNAFSLPAQAVSNPDGRDHCPGSTVVCRASCYVGGLAKHAAATYELYEKNAAAIRRILHTCDSIAIEGDAIEFGLWIEDNCAGGFRWHVSGDIFSDAYAAWIARVVAESPHVRHWIYTRSFDAVDLAPLFRVSTLVGGNLALNLSCDADNYEAARAWAYYHRYGDATPTLCYLSHDGTVPDDLPDGSVVFPDYKYRGGEGSPWWDSLTPRVRRMVCPVDALGKSESIRCGVCRKCM